MSGESNGLLFDEEYVPPPGAVGGGLAGVQASSRYAGRSCEVQMGVQYMTGYTKLLVSLFRTFYLMRCSNCYVSIIN